MRQSSDGRCYNDLLMSAYPIKNFIRFAIIASLFIGIAVCGLLCWLGSNAQYLRLFQETKTLKQQEILQLENQVFEDFNVLKERLVKTHKSIIHNSSEETLRKGIQLLLSEEKISGISHDLMLLNSLTKKNFFLGMRDFFAGRFLISNLRGSLQRCRGRGMVTRDLRIAPIPIHWDDQYSKVWISKLQLERADLLDSEKDGQLRVKDFWSCLRNMTQFHYDSFVNASVSEDDIQSFWDLVRQDKPPSFAHFIERESKAFPKLFTGFSYLNLLLASNSISGTIPLISEGIRFENFFSKRMQIDPLEALEEFIEIQGQWVHMQNYVRPWKQKPEQAISMIADGVSLLRLNKNIPVMILAKRVENLGYSTDIQDNSEDIVVFSSSMNQNLKWTGWISSSEKLAVIWRWLASFLVIVLIHLLLGYFMFKKMILPIENSIQSLIMGKQIGTEWATPLELIHIDKAYTSMRENQNIFQEDFIMRTAFANVLLDSRLNVDKMLEVINSILKDMFEGVYLERVHGILNNNNVISIDPIADVRKDLEREWKMQFPIYYRIVSSSPLRPSLIKILSETLENMFLSSHTHYKENLFKDKKKDIEQSHNYNQFASKPQNLAMDRWQINTKLETLASGLGEGIELTQTPESIFILLVAPQCDPPGSLLISQSLRSFISVASDSTIDMPELFDKVCAYAHSITRDTETDLVLSLVRLARSSNSIEFAGKGPIFYQQTALATEDSPWMSIHIKSDLVPSKVHKLELNSGQSFRILHGAYNGKEMLKKGLEIQVQIKGSEC